MSLCLKSYGWVLGAYLCLAVLSLQLSFDARLDPNVESCVERNGDYRYFGYGSNMFDGSRKWKMVDAHSNQPAILLDWTLKFNVLTPDGSTAANVQYSPGNETHGVFMDMSPGHMKLLDKQEPPYIRTCLPIKLYNGSSTMAFVYVANAVSSKKSRDFQIVDTTQNVYPSNDYLNNLIVGAEQNRLTTDYINKLRKVQTAPVKPFDPKKFALGTTWTRQDLEHSNLVTCLGLVLKIDPDVSPILGSTSLKDICHLLTLRSAHDNSTSDADTEQIMGRQMETLMKTRGVTVVGHLSGV